MGGFGAVYKAEDTIAFGSPGYAAPEQYGRAQTTPRSDIYSLGAMLHQMLTGQDPSLNPFRFQPLSVSDRTLPIKLEKLIAQMLETDMQPDGHMIVSAEGKSAIQVWDARLRKQWLLYQRHSNAVEDVAWSPDGQRIASVSFDGTVHLWRALDGKEAFVYRGHEDSVLTVAWSPDGQHLASAGRDDLVHVWKTV